MTTYAVITFHTTHFSLFETIPVPREFSSDCGFCCKVLWDSREKARMILEQNHVEFDHIYRWERDEEKEKKKVYRFV